MNQTIIDQACFKTCFAAFVKSKLLQQQCNLEQLAEKARVSAKTIKRYLYGNLENSPRIRLSTYYKILAALDSHHEEFNNYLLDYQAPQNAKTETEDDTVRPPARRFAWQATAASALFFAIGLLVYPWITAPKDTLVMGLIVNQDLQPVQNASVSLSGYSQGTYSKSNGEFSISLDKAKPGRVISILIAHPDYQSYWYDYTIGKEHDKFNVVLSDASN